MSLNVAVFMGRLTADPDVKQTASGVSVAKFTIACDRNYKSDTKETDFIPCTAWRGTADFLGKWFRKGDMIALKGSFRSDQFTDKDGNKRTSYGIVADEVSFCGGKNNAENGNTTEAKGIDVADDDDDFPFG